MYICVCVGLYVAMLYLNRYKCGGFSFSLKQKALQIGASDWSPEAAFSVRSRRSIANPGKGERDVKRHTEGWWRVEGGKEGETGRDWHMENRIDSIKTRWQRNPFISATRSLVGNRRKWNKVRGDESRILNQHHCKNWSPPVLASVKVSECVMPRV